jgi:four helix bundle protein
MQNDNLILNKSNELAHLVYKITRSFPKEEVYGLTSQIRMSATSVPANITEGFARNSDKSNKQFLMISYDSLQELKYFLTFSRDEGYVDKVAYDEMLGLAEECSKMLWKSIKTLETKCYPPNLYL